MRRKLISMANKTLLVSIPVTTVRKYNLKKGEEVEVEELSNELRIKVNQSFQDDTSVLQVQYSEFLLDFIDLFYTSGFDKIEIYYKDSNCIEPKFDS